MGQIPLDGLLDAVGKLGLRQPAKFVVDLGRIDSVTHIMALAVCYIGDKAFGLAKLLADQLYNINVSHFIVAAYIVNLADSSIVDDQVDSAAVILYIQPVADI